ncbi:class II aldolase/adducin family protein [Candidatus Dependentiae bacterium]|nr:class II aldolase/adducin family protein [Candidatus Dependentiae bacterium]
MNTIKSEIVKYGRIAFEHNLVFGASGNISIKSKNKIFITKSGSYLGYLTEKDILCFDFNRNKPECASMETQMHLNCYAANPEISAVFHSQPLYATIIASSNLKINLNYIPESMYYINKIGYIPYAHAGSLKLAELTGNKAKDCDIILLKNHGLTVTAKNLNEALLKTISFEFLAASTVSVNQKKIKLIFLSEQTRNDFKNQIYKNKKK